MKKSKNLLALILFQILFISNIFSIDLYRDIKIQEEILKEKIIKQIESENLFQHQKKLEVESYAGFTISCLDTINNNDSLSVEDMLNYYIIKSDSGIFYLYNYVFVSYNIGIKNYLKQESFLLDAINFAKSKSNTVFFLSLKDGPVIAYIENNNVKIIDTDLKCYESIEYLIKYRYGIENYNNQIKRDKFKLKYYERISSFDNAKKFYKKYWFNYYFNNVYDPEALSDAVIYEIEEFQIITDYQKSEIKKMLMDVIIKNELGKKDPLLIHDILELDRYVSTFDSSIKKVLKKVLLENQYFTYLNNEELYSQLNDIAKDIIYTNYHNLHPDVLHEKILKDVFNQ